MSFFGGQLAASQPSLFNQTQSAPSLFGAPSGQSAASLFGAPAGQSTSLFGAPSSSASLFGAPAAPSGTLFGAPASSASFGAPTSSASLFGTPANSGSSLVPISSGSIFGAPVSSPSIFGSTGGSAPLSGMPVNSGFGQTTSAPGFGAASSSLFAPNQPQTNSIFSGFQPMQQQPQQQQPQQQQQQQQQQLQLQPFTQPLNQNASGQQPAEFPGQTKINQLPEKYRAELFAVERHLRDQRAKFNILWSKRSSFDDLLGSVRQNTDDIMHAVVKARAEIDAMQTNASSLRAAVAMERSSAEPVFIALDNLVRSMGYGVFLDSNDLRYGSGDPARFQRAAHVPDEYFQRIVDELESRAHIYKAEIDEIAQYLRAQGVSIGNSGTVGGMVTKPRSGHRMHGALLLDNISQRYSNLKMNGNGGGVIESRGKTIEDVIRRQYDYFMVVASHIAGVNEQLRNLRELFLHALKARDADAANPFEQADLREKADKDRQRILAERNAVEVNAANGPGMAMVPYSQGNAPANPNNMVLTTGALTPSTSVENGHRSSFGMVGMGTEPDDRRMSALRRRKW